MHIHSNKKRPVRGIYPDRLFKVFEKEEYRESFLSGRFWMGGINKYKTIESKTRRDNSEGMAIYKFLDTVQTIHVARDSEVSYITEAPGLMQTTSTLCNPVYLLCAATEKADLTYLKKQFGNYLVEITRPIDLANDILEYYINSERNIIGGIEGEHVIYNKGETIAAQLETHENTKLSYTQKPSVFSSEHEFRYIVKFGGTAKQTDHIEVNLGKALSYAKAI